MKALKYAYTQSNNKTLTTFYDVRAVQNTLRIERKIRLKPKMKEIKRGKNIKYKSFEKDKT